MDGMTALIDALAALAWPLLLAGVLLWLREPLRSLLDSAASRRFTLKVGGNELTMEEASEQQRALIQDLQQQIVAIRQELTAQPHPPTKRLPDGDFPLASEGTGRPGRAARSGDDDSPGPAPEPPVSSPATVLWVDDQPRNNSTLIAHLEEMGLSVETVGSTQEALGLLERRRYDRVITDMGRFEGGTYHATAGIDLVRALRNLGSEVPVIVYTSREQVRSHHEEAEQAGAQLVTASPTAMLAGLSLEA